MGKELVVLILLFPLAGFLINGLLGKWLKKPVSGLIACLMPALSFMTCLAFIQKLPGVHNYFTWINTQTIKLDFALRLDELSIIMCLVITGVGTLIHIYSLGYMKKDEGFARYFAYLNFFMFLMLLLVLSDNLVLMFVGWEGVGLCSFLLIGFWYHDLPRADAAKKAFIVNRVGDFAFLLAVFLIFSQVGKLDFGSLADSKLDTNVLNIACLLLFIGACGKSAQIPLYVWLPDAMAGPTPVSALIHAATMVTAGVYMIARMNFYFMSAEMALGIIGGVCAVTALVAALMACSENNLKKVLAYSTISQLAYMFCALAMKSVAGPIFHLTMHAFFKALLFLCAGIIIHGLAGEEDMRKMGGIRKKDKLAFLVFLVGAISLCGIPPFSGFFSKEVIIVSSFEAQPVIGVILMATSLITSFYILRAIALVFFGKPKSDEYHSATGTMKFSVVILTVLSIVGGIAGTFIYKLLEDLPLSHNFVEHHHGFNLTIFCIAGVGFFLTMLVVYLLYGPKEQLRQKILAPFRPLVVLVERKFFIDELYDYLFVLPLKLIAFIAAYLFDLLFVDRFLVHGTSTIFYKISGALRRVHTGSINASLFVIALGTVGLLGYIVYILFKGLL